MPPASWLGYSLIHFDPEQVPSVLRELARRLTPGGLLLLGLFEGDEIARFPHAVTPAYSWPVGDLCRILSAAGFEEECGQAKGKPKLQQGFGLTCNRKGAGLGRIGRGPMLA